MAEDMRKILRILEKVHRVNYCSFCQEPFLKVIIKAFAESAEISFVKNVGSMKWFGQKTVD